MSLLVVVVQEQARFHVRCLSDVLRYSLAEQYVREKELPGGEEACGRRMVVRQLRGYHCLYEIKTQDVETRSTVIGIPESELLIC